MALYRTRQGDSPAIIARRHGTTVAALLAANPQKPTTVVAGRRTWQGLQRNEPLSMPVGIGALGDGEVGLGDAASDALNALVSAGGPCNSANVTLVCAAQRALGFVPGAGLDGKWGTTDAASAAKRGITIPACSPRPSWWTPKGQSNCYATGGTPSGGGTPTVTPATSGSSLDRAAGAAYSALGADPNYCASVRRVGSAVNTAVHNFKAAWNSANPSRAVPIGTGNYEVSVAAALSSALGGIQVPPGCGAAGTVPPSVTPQVTPSGGGGVPSGGGGSVPSGGGGVSGTPYTVQSGDTGSKLAQRYTGNPNRWPELLVTNPRLKDPKYGIALYVGKTIILPASWTATAASGGGGGGTPAGGGGTPSGGGGMTPAGADRPIGACWNADGTPSGACPPETYAAWNKAQADLKAAQQASADAAAKLAAAIAAGDKAAADAAANAKAIADKSAADALAKKSEITPPEAKKGLSTGAIVVGAVGAAALVGLIALAVSGKKTGHRGTRGPRGARGPKRRKATRHGSKRKKASKRRR